MTHFLPEKLRRASVRSLHLVVLGGLLLTAWGCHSPESAGPAGAAAQQMPPPVVDAVPAVTDNIREYRDYTGRTAAANTVQLRARVSGYLLQAPQPALAKTEETPVTPDETVDPDSTSRNVDRVVSREGEEVARGTLLFQVDPEPYELALQQAEGNLETARAQLNRYELDLKRSRELFQSKATSRSELDLAIANRAEAQGSVKNLEAIVERAKLDLQYTRVVAPITGLLGKSMVTPGNLIAADTTLLTTIVSTKPIYVEFDVDERSVLDYRSRIASGDVPSARKQQIPVQLGLATDEGFPHEGYIDFVDNQTDPTTGNTNVRATFPNDQGTLSPGFFARVRVPFSSDYRAILVPTRAIGTDQQGKFVWVVEAGKAQRRSIRPGMVKGDRTVITDGLKGDEMVIVSGLQKVRPGAEVQISQPDDSTKPTTESNSPPLPEQSSQESTAEQESAEGGQL